MRIQSLLDLHFSFPDIDGFWNLQNLQETEDKIRNLVPSSIDHPTHLQIETLTQLARVFGMQGKLKQARDVLTFCDVRMRELDADAKIKSEIRYYLEEGRIYSQSMFPMRALESYSVAWLKSKDSEFQYLAVDAAYMISITMPVKDGKKWLQTAISIAEKSENEHCRSWLSQLYLMAGWQSFDLHQFEKALYYFEKAQYICGPKVTDLDFRRLKWSKARALRALGKIENSLQIQEGIQEELERLGEPNGHVFLEIAECHRALNHTEKSRTYFEMAFNHLKMDNWFSDNCGDALKRIQKNSKK